jgi:hypothetical protein
LNPLLGFERMASVMVPGDLEWCFAFLWVGYGLSFSSGCGIGSMLDSLSTGRLEPGSAPCGGNGESFP